ncbi:MAG: phage major capsid protein [Clostridium sp.]|nr:phage major capsid protein [Clostridium sp.]
MSKTLRKMKRIEYRALPEESKGLEEKRNDLVDEMEQIVNNAKSEVRALSDEEDSRFEEIKTEIEAIDKTLEKSEETRSLADRKVVKKEKQKEERSQEQINNEELRSIFNEEREAAPTMNSGTNEEGGYVINKILSKEIIKEIKDRSDVYKFFNGTTVKGNYKIPKKTASGKAEWVDENPTTDPTATIPKLELIELGQNRLYRESAITKSMVNVEELDLQGFIKDDIADSMTDAVEDAIFNGDGKKKPTGVISGIKKKNQISLDTRNVFTIDALKKAKAKLKQAVVKKAKWFMNSDTFLELDLLKDGMGRSLIQPDPTSETGYVLLGLPVVLTDALKSPEDAGANCLIVLATPAAYHTNTQNQLALYVYTDSTYTRKGLIGYGADLYMDGKPKDDQQAAGIYNVAESKAA